MPIKVLRFCGSLLLDSPKAIDLTIKCNAKTLVPSVIGEILMLILFCL